MRCRCCQGSDLYGYLDLGEQPLANAYVREDTQADQVRFPLQTDFCRGCGHSQLSVVVDPKLMFSEYLYVSGTTATFRAHCDELARDAIENQGGPCRVLDIGCNDGTLLDCFRSRGCEVAGVDPAGNLSAVTKEKGISVEVCCWGAGAAERVKPKGPFRIVTATNVFAHVDDARGFLDAVASVLAPNGLLIIEFPYARDTLLYGQFDQIYHEHVSYFLAGPVTLLFERAGFHVVAVALTSVHGGSIRFQLRRSSSEIDANHCAALHELVESEHADGLYRVETYDRFRAHVENTGRALRAAIDAACGRGRTIVGYGASAKGNTMLNAFDIDVEYIVDDNELKWGYRTPGRGIPIVSPTQLDNDPRPLGIVMLAWNFYPEIRRRILSRRGAGDDAIFYVPEVRTEAITNAS